MKKHIPVRFVLAVLISLLETLAVIGIVVFLDIRFSLFRALVLVTQMVCVLRIVASDDNPDYKVPWLLVVLTVPIAGFMVYFMFYSRKLKRKYLKRRKELLQYGYRYNDGEAFEALRRRDEAAFAQAKMLTEIAGTHLFTDTRQQYFALGEHMYARLLQDLQGAERFIYLEFFIIEAGEFWDSVLAILRQKVQQGVQVKVLYDDIGCMTTLPGNYYKTLQRYGIDAAPFGFLRGNADSEFNNRSHRKILVIDGKVGYTGGVNLADEYINRKVRFGHWKDTAVRLEGEAVWQLTRLFIEDFGVSVRGMPARREDWYPEQAMGEDGFLVPFGDGPRPLYARNVGKSVIQNLLYGAKRYVYMTTPYLIIDNDLCTDIENTAMRGVDVRIIVPHIPDKKTVFEMTRSFYPRLIAAGVKIYEYTPGFIHAKSYLADDDYAMIGTVNLDYRSLVHHFENGVWMYRCACLKDLKADIEQTMCQSRRITKADLRTGPLRSLLRAVVRIFSPML